ncbi:MAG: hypothetical protein WKF91_14850 [Segetibacter sp.]
MANQHAENLSPQKDVISSGHHLSFWTSSIEPISFGQLQSNIETDVLVVGGGISGVTIAYCLAKLAEKWC